MSNHTQFNNYIKVRQFPLKEQVDPTVPLSLQTIYPEKYLALVQRLAQVFQQLSETSPDAFRGTSSYWIKKQIINGNHPTLAALKAAQGGQSIWRELTTVLVNDCPHSFLTRTVWVAIEKIYFSYRNLIIHNATLQLLAGYLSDSAVVSDAQLERLFREDTPPRHLARKLFGQLTQDLSRHFPRWQGAAPKWHIYLNTLRQVRNMSCDFLTEDHLYAAIERCTTPPAIEAYAETIVQSFKKNKKQLPLDEYLVFLLMLKLKRPLKKLFPQIWNEHIKGSESLDNRSTPPGLTGLRAFIFAFTIDHFRKNNLKTYTQLSAKEAWATIKPALTKRVEQAREAFPKAFPKNSKTWVANLAEQGIRAVLEDLCRAQASTGTPPQLNPSDFPNKRRAFRAVHRDTPLSTFPLSPSGAIQADQLHPCLEAFIRTRCHRKAEELLRADLASVVLPQLRVILTDQAQFVNANPVFTNSGFSLNLADRQMFDLDLTGKTLSLALVRTGKKTVRHTFSIHDPDDRLQPFLNPSLSLVPTQEPSWEVLNPTIVEKHGKLAIHIPFQLKDVPEIPPIQFEEPVEELVFGNDLGLNTYNYLAVIRTVSVYRQTETGQIDRKVLEREDLAHYSIDDLEALHKSFDVQSGTFQNLRTNPEGQPVRRKRNGNRAKQIGCNTWGKGHLRVLFTEIRQIQAQLNALKAQYPRTYTAQPSYHKRTSHLSRLWKDYGEVQTAIVNGVAVKTRDIVLYWHAQYPALSVRVQVEDLRFSHHSPKTQAGYYLAHNQKNFFHSQMQQQLAHLLRPYGIGVWRVRAAYTSQTCNYCGHYTKDQRIGRVFQCKNQKHRTPKGKSYTCNSDLNAGRNVAVFPPRKNQPVLS